MVRHRLVLAAVDHPGRPSEVHGRDPAKRVRAVLGDVEFRKVRDDDAGDLLAETPEGPEHP